MIASVLELNSQKADLRKEAFARRKTAHGTSNAKPAQDFLLQHVLDSRSSGIIAGYMPIQTEIDPRPSLNALHEAGFRICLPVIQGHAKPLLFREWTPESAMIEGDFGALIPRGGETVTPDLAIVPLVAFDLKGHRLGYGGGFYDRTLSGLKQNADFTSVGFAYAAQCISAVPTDEFDQKLDFMVTEKGVQHF